MPALLVKDGKVVLSEQAKAMPEWKKLIANDRTQSKKNVDKWLTYLYFMYGKDSEYANMLETNRQYQVVVKVMGLEKGSHKHFEKILDWIIAFYKKSQRVDPTEEFLDNLFSDMDALVRKLNDIKWTKKTKTEIPRQMVSIVDGDGKRVEAEIPSQTVEIEMVNTAEKTSAYNSVEKILDLKDKYYSKIESNARKKRRNTRLFDGAEE